MRVFPTSSTYLGSGQTVYEVDRTQFESVRTQVLSLLDMLGSSTSSHLDKLYQRVLKLGYEDLRRQELVGILEGLRKSVEAGLLSNISHRIEATISSDYLGQAEQLLQEGQPGKYDHVPAAVLTGSILENGLRTLCSRAVPEISTVKANGEPKTLNVLIDDLKKAEVFNELKAKQLRSWADIRNAAAHGEFEKFGRQDVEQMLVGVRNFLADYL
jgi:hypothetical protein